MLKALISAPILSILAIPIILKVLTALGIGYATYTGIGAVLDYGLDTIEALFGALPSSMLQIVAMTNIDKYITMVFSAYAMRLVISGVTGGSIKKWIFG